MLARTMRISVNSIRLSVYERKHVHTIMMIYSFFELVDYTRGFDVLHLPRVKYLKLKKGANNCEVIYPSC